MNEENRVIDIREGEEAKQLIANKQITEAFDTIERQYMDAFLLASEKDDLGRFRYAEAIKVVRMVRSQLANAVKNGQLSAFELSELNKRKGFGFL